MTSTDGTTQPKDRDGEVWVIIEQFFFGWKIQVIRIPTETENKFVFF